MEKPSISRISPDHLFNFECHPGISCFNECCQNLQQVLAPYDIIRLKHHFKCNSSTFLNTYTISYTGFETGLPIVELKNKSHNDLHCTFVSENGCMVYPDRPSTCRYYPLGRLVSKSRETGKIDESYIKIQEDHCKGHDSLCKQSINLWRQEQDLHIFDKYNDLMINLISAKNKAGLRRLSDDQRYLIYISCYDIDTFRQFAKEQKMIMNQTYPHTIDGDIQCFLYAMKWLEEAVIK
jgi:hypothetical protein